MEFALVRTFSLSVLTVPITDLGSVTTGGSVSASVAWVGAVPWVEVVAALSEGSVGSASLEQPAKVIVRRTMTRVSAKSLLNCIFGNRFMAIPPFLYILLMLLYSLRQEIVNGIQIKISLISVSATAFLACTGFRK